VSAVVDDARTFASDLLPSGWSSVTLEDVVGEEGVFVDGDWVESKDQDPQGDVRLIQLADVGDSQYRDRSERFLTSQKASELGCTFLEPGDLLIARMPEPLDRACIFPGDAKQAVTIVDVAVVRPRNPELNVRWLMYCINAPQFRRVVASLQSGSTRQRISRKNLAKIVFPMPPRRLQDETVAEIEKQFSRLDEAVANLKRVKANLKRYKAAVLKAAVEGRLVPTEAELARREGRGYEPAEALLELVREERRASLRGGSKFREAAPPMIGRGPLPEGWTWASLEQLCTVFVDSPHRTPKYGEGSYVAVGPRDVVGGILALERARPVSESECYVPDSQRNLRSGFLTYIEGKERDFVGEIARRRG
jgi:type I restriction enzyme S subunit